MGTHTEDVVFALQDRLAAYHSTRDPQLLLLPEALAEADRLYYTVDWYAPREDWVDAARAFTIALMVARLHWERWQLLGEQDLPGPIARDAVPDGLPACPAARAGAAVRRLRGTGPPATNDHRAHRKG